jgi:hypothetical protein
MRARHKVSSYGKGDKTIRAPKNANAICKPLSYTIKISQFTLGPNAMEKY